MTRTGWWTGIAVMVWAFVLVREAPAKRKSRVSKPEKALAIAYLEARGATKFGGTLLDTDATSRLIPTPLTFNDLCTKKLSAYQSPYDYQDRLNKLPTPKTTWTLVSIEPESALLSGKGSVLAEKCQPKRNVARRAYKLTAKARGGEPGEFQVEFWRLKKKWFLVDWKDIHDGSLVPGAAPGSIAANLGVVTLHLGDALRSRGKSIFRSASEGECKSIEASLRETLATNRTTLVKASAVDTREQLQQAHPALTREFDRYISVVQQCAKHPKLEALRKTLADTGYWPIAGGDGTGKAVDPGDGDKPRD